MIGTVAIILVFFVGTISLDLEVGFFVPFSPLIFIFIIIGGLGNSRGAFAGTTLVTLFLRGAQIDAIQKKTFN